MARPELLVLLAGVVSIAFLGIDGQQLTPAEVKKIDDFIKGAMECQHYTGLMISVVRGGETVLAKGYGYAVFDDEDPSQNVNNTEDTLFPIASVSKHFTSSMIGHVLQNTTYDWDSNFRQMMKELHNKDFYFNDVWRTNKATLRDLLSHRMGTSGQDVILAVDQWTKSELMERIRFLRPNAEFRSSMLYNNIFYAVATYVAELHDGKEWDELIRDNFFKPLGMNRSSTIRLGMASNYSGWARPHVNLGHDPSLNETSADDVVIGPWPMWVFRGVANGGAGAGGIATTAKDMAEWMKFQLNYETRPDIMEPNITWDIREPINTYSLQLRLQDVRPNKDFMSTQELAYAMGITNGFWRGNPMLCHDGSILLYTSHIALLPLMDIGVFVTSNQAAPYLNDIRMFILDVLLGVKEPWMNINRFCSLDFPVILSYQPKYSSNNEDFGLRYGIETMLKTIKREKLINLHERLANKDISRFGSNKNLYAFASAIKELPLQSKRKRPRSEQRADDFEKYVGTFGNFAYGNLTIEIYKDEDLIDAVLAGDLLLKYGWLELTLDRIGVIDSNVFKLTVLNIYEPTTDKVTFWSSKGDSTIDRLELSLDPADKPYTWARNLRFTDAPPPTADECPTQVPCTVNPPRSCPGSEATGLKMSFSLIILTVFRYWFCV